MRYFKTPRSAEKVIDCSKINNICEIIESPITTIDKKAQIIYNQLCQNTFCDDAKRMLDGLVEEIINNNYQTGSELSNAVWLRYRHLGIGGSDAAAIVGNSKFRTILDLYYDKRNEAIKEKIDDGKRYRFDFGHAMEAFVAEEFSRRFKEKYLSNFELKFSMYYGKTIHIKECKIYRDTYMYRNPKYPFMIADLDFVIEFELDNGKILKGIFECKTTSPFTISDDWKENAPVYYQTQTNHYMSVMDYDFAVIACAADNNYANYYTHIIFRDKDFEQNLIKKEKRFWNDVAIGNPPYQEGIDNLKLIANHMGLESEDVLKLSNNPNVIQKLRRYNDIKEEISGNNSLVNQLKNEQNIIISDILSIMGKANTPTAVANDLDTEWTISVISKKSSAIDYTKFFNQLRKLHPELSDEIDALKEDCLKDPAPKKTVMVKANKNVA